MVEGRPEAPHGRGPWPPYEMKCFSSRYGAMVMICNILLCIAVFACLLSQAEALPSNMIDSVSLDLLGDFSEQMQNDIDADNSIQDVNVTGAWFIELMGEPREKMKLYLLQNGSLISGQGEIIEGEIARTAAARGSISGLEMSLNVLPEGAADSYHLNLSLSSLAGGHYLVHQADGASRSGRFTFAVSANIFKAASESGEW